MTGNRMRRRAAALVLGLAATAGLAGCAGASGDATGDAPLVGVAMPTTTSARWIADGENLQRQLDALGYTVDLEYAEDDVPTQVAQLEQMITDGADALVVGAIDGTALKGVLAKAAAADIPIVSYDRLIRDSPDVDYYASFDNWRVGVLQATSLLQGLGVVDETGARTSAPGPFSVELFAGSPDDNNATVFYNGAMSVLTPLIDSGVLVVPSGQTEFTAIATQGWSGDVAAERMTTLLPLYQGTGVHLDGVLSPYDGISRSIIATVSGLGGTLPVVSGQDAELDSVKSIVAGEQYSTVYKDTRQLAEVAVSMVRALLDGTEPEVNDTTTYDNGQKVVPSYLLAPQLVTVENYEPVLIESGYYEAGDL
ncbi:multiple monosaccharide ABC transporter substrate-binding protein [Cellulomonas soli]|uniref:Multiple sugar-binding periplasmic receptor ChvE n=1 Tax=Cellulomonas soli TaxID=931535 RepID=A0A512PEL5_9CELL|nr:multiple monosaccharide ABC transporter substrate-binding protein [Cellulomonas soli]NYI59564.1 putative multiple sugar transport system substrate-binding protein [Cellulomonas soli]GEP69645.1 multiple sugar-binding periplasmic receptor ChvE [Cellulomonas soli]